MACLLGFSVLGFTYQKLKRTGLSVDHVPSASVGEEVRFIFSAGDNVQRIKIFSDRGSLGTIKTIQNKAKLNFTFGFPSVKKLRFFGISANNDTVSVAYRDIEIIGKTLGRQVVATPSQGETSASTDPNPPSTRTSLPIPITNLRFNPTPVEDPFNGKIRTFTELPSGILHRVKYSYKKTGAWKPDYSDIPRFCQGQIAAVIEKYSAAYTFIYKVGERGYTHKEGKFYADRIIKVIDRYELIEVD